MNKEEPKSAKQWSPYGLALSIGYMIVTPILIFGIGGVMLDRYFQIFPIFTLIGFFLSMTSGLIIVYKKTKDIINQ